MVEQEVAILKEFLIPREEKKAVEEEEGDGDRERSSGMNVKRPKKNNSDEVSICKNVASGLPCSVPKCRFSHDVEMYLALKEKDLEGECPASAKNEACRFGIRCRFASKHKEGLVYQLGKDESGLNVNDLQKSLRQKTRELPKVKEYEKIMSQKPKESESVDEYFCKLRPEERKKVNHLV
jgi:tRNA-dihydrouridine synthase 3